MKLLYNKQKPKVIQYRMYKDFSNDAFMHELESILQTFSQISFGTFKSTVDNILQKDATLKKVICPSKSSFIHKQQNTKRNNERIRLTNKFIESKTEADRIACNKQRNYCVSLMQK